MMRTHHALATCAAAVVGAALVLASCSGSDTPDPRPTSEPSTSTSPSAEAGTDAEGAGEEADEGPGGGAGEDPTSVEPVPEPRVGQCHRLSWQRAVSPVSDAPPVPCRRPHTAQTYAVGKLSLVVDGERLPVDDAAVQDKPAAACPRRLAGHLGVPARALRLTMARPVWFTPTLEEAEAGANWFRCDVVVLAAPEKLQRVPRRTAGTGDSDAIAMCGTSRPGTEAFTRVSCRRRHSWRAVASVDLPGRRFPAVDVMADRMREACRAAARARADDPLDFEWSEERPSREQWRAGRRYGLCWVPTT